MFFVFLADPLLSLHKVPYIYSYRRYCIADFHKDFSISREILDRRNLWDIYDWEYEYRLLLEKRELTQERLLNRRDYDDEDYEYILNLLRSPLNEESLSDLNDYILHTYSKKLAEVAIKDPSTHQHLKDYYFYIECFNKGSHELVKVNHVIYFFAIPFNFFNLSFNLHQVRIYIVYGC